MRFRLALSAAILASSVVGCSSTTTPRQTTVALKSITINNAPFFIERGFHVALTATTTDSITGKIDTVPVVFRSTNEKVATIDANGQLAAVDTGSTSVFALSLGKTSAGIQVVVVWTGPAKIAQFQFTPPGAVSPGATPDSIRAVVTNLSGAPVLGARVAFKAATGGGTVSPAIATTNVNGVAAASWTLGPAVGPNTATATILGENDIPFAFVSPNVVTFSLNTYSALVAVTGGGQTGQVLSALPVSPSVKLVDSTGKPRAGVPVKFATTGGGRVASPAVSTGADGVASPGVWTLGDASGDETLVATVESASISFHATATGTAIHFTPLQNVAGAFSTCAIVTGNSVSCFGAEPNVGDSGTVARATPTPTRTTATFLNLAASATNPGHFCGVSSDHAIYCWGPYSFADTNGAVAHDTSSAVPTRLSSNITWSQVAPGQAHNCALAADQTAYCWGDNSVGQLGTASSSGTQFVPAPVSGGFKFNSIVSGQAHSCGLTLDGSVYCWGQNPNGQLGDGTTTTRTTPTLVVGGLSFQAIAASGSTTCGITTTGKSYCWGALTVASPTVSTPRAYATAPTFSSIAVGGAHQCALTPDGTAYCWGNNSVGQVGDSTTTERANPTAVSTSLKFKSISTGYAHTCASTADGSVACWGLNTVGELGDTTATNRLTPRFIILGVNP